MSIESVMPSNHLVPYRPLLLLPSIFPSIRVFSPSLSGSLSPSLLLIPPIVFFLYDWSFFTFSSSLLKFSLCSCILFLNWVSLIADVLLIALYLVNYVFVSLGLPYCFNRNKSFCLLILLIFLCLYELKWDSYLFPPWRDVPIWECPCTVCRCPVALVGELEEVSTSHAFFWVCWHLLPW